MRNVKRRLGMLGVLLGLMLTMLPLTALGQFNQNITDDLKERYPHVVACYKYESVPTDNAHGKTGQPNDDGEHTAVRLKPYGPNFPGDHWEYLFIKSGQQTFELQHPVAGVWYSPPAKDTKKGPKFQEVSHWIVCKGETPSTTTTTLPEETTTTTIPEETTTTVPEETTTTVTVPPTTEPPVTIPPVTEPPVTQPPATRPPVTQPPAITPVLPFTGIETRLMGIGGIILFGGGLALLVISRNKEEDVYDLG